MDRVELIRILPMLVGGLVIFLYAIRRLSLSLQEFFSEGARSRIERYTSNIFYSILVGVIVTILLDSSSAVIIIAIILINAGSLSFKQVMGIVMGANIGTTFSSQLIAFNISRYAFIPLGLAFFFWLFSKPGAVKRISEVMMYFAFLFFGLYVLEAAVLPLKESEIFNYWLVEMKNPLKGAATGGFVTLIIQSSSATVAMLITLAKQDLITLAAAIAAMLGAELGTCSDTLLAVIGGKRDAVRAGVFHLLFNLIPIAIGLIFFQYFVTLVEWFSPGATVARSIANAHVLFSILSVLLFLPFVGWFYKLLKKIIPDRQVLPLN